MVESDRFKTQRDAGLDVITELRVAGFDDADEIGRGGFGAVYRCTQVAVDRTVAVKVLTAELEGNRERFLREQRAMGRLTGHPNIAGMLEVGETGSGLPFLVMPYYSRGSLDARIRHDGPLSLAEMVHVGVKMAGALESAHRAGVLHRDIKPANILLTDYDEPTLTDFGIAHITGGFETTSGTITGSPAFTAPEVLGGQGPSPASDVYGLGATLFCALTGHAAFERGRDEQMVAQFVRITSHPIPDLRESGIPEDVCAVIEAAMSRDPQGRPTAAELGERLRRIQLDHGFTVDEMALRAKSGSGPETSAPSEPVVAQGVPRIPSNVLHDMAGNLPLELTSFVDRRTELSEVGNLLPGSRLVTVTGIGGVGKSRLALRVAHKVRRKFANGAWLIELGELSDDGLLPDVVAAAFGMRSQGSRSVLDTLVEALAPHELLLVLDNCEHVIDAVAKLSESLLRVCPDVRILATSREAVGIGGETVYPLQPLSIPDSTSQRALAQHHAVTLFIERATSAVPGFEVTEGTEHSIAQICTKLDGLPLAIELAAARLRTMSVEQIQIRLSDRYSLLTRGGRGAPKRQQTLGYCMGWSYDLCTPGEKRLWAGLSVFAGGFELDAAEQVCAGEMTESELLDTLAALVEKSILSRQETDGTVRFRMLETVLEFGREKAEDSGEYPSLLRRHRDWCERLVYEADAELLGPRQLEWVARLERELPNLRKALEFNLPESGDGRLAMIATLYLFWTLRGRINEGRRWYERVLEHSPGGGTSDRAKALFAAGSMAAMQRDIRTAVGQAEELRTLAEQAEDPFVRALVAHLEAIVALANGDAGRSDTAASLADVVRSYEVCGDFGAQLEARISLGWAYATQGDASRAVACHEKTISITEDAGETIYRSWALWGAGFAVWRGGEAERATHLLEDGIRLSERMADPLVAAGCLETLAWIAADGREAQRAAVLMGAADALGLIAGTSTPFFPELLAYRDEYTLSSRRVLGVRAFDKARGEGAAMSLDAAVRFALHEQSEAGPATHHSSEDLTKREWEVADLVAEGLTNSAIASRLVISQRTAQGHVEHILAKLGFTSRAQIASWVTAHSNSKSD
ncbi:protein kinase domain-containing protein [Nocardia tengchongensis]|uniref:protein kinase domain-containing protein n=1 Tax=Nocardia tengchongensis TaxID=2055889 RepID=UPI00368136A8